MFVHVQEAVQLVFKCMYIVHVQEVVQLKGAVRKTYGLSGER